MGPTSLLPQYNFPEDAIFEIDGALHKNVGETIAGFVHLMHIPTCLPFRMTGSTGQLELPTPRQLDELLREGRLVVKEPPRATMARKIAAEAEWDGSDCDQLDPKARKRKVQCDLLDAKGVPNGIKAISLTLADHWTPDLREKFGEHDNPHTIKRWRSDRGAPGDRDLKDMVDMRGKVARSNWLDDVVEEVKQKAALRYWASKSDMSYQDVASLVEDEIRDINEGRSKEYPKPDEPYTAPHYSTVRRACQALECDATEEARNGKQAVEANRRGAGRPLTAKRALELVIIDHTRLNGFFVIDPEREMSAGRPWLSTVIDVHSEAIIAHLISYLDPSVWTIGELLRRATLPKRPPPCLEKQYPVLRRICGKPAEIIVDNGTEFRSQGFEDAVKGAGIAVRRCPIKKPRYRAMGERIFPTLQDKTTKLLPAGTKPIAMARKLGYDPEKHALVTVNELEAAMNYAVAEYHVDTHDGLNKRQPALIFEKSANKHGIDLIWDLKAFQREIMDVVHKVQLSNSGVRQWGLRFHCARAVPELLNDLVRVEPRRQRKEYATATVKFKFDPLNIAKIYVWNRVTRKYVTLHCEDETYADGMPLWFHEQLMDAAKAEGEEFNTHKQRMAIRARRIKAIKNISPEAKHQERKTVARLYEIPRLRQITGNIVHLHTDEPEAVVLDDFISHDLAATTMLDDEILAPRPPFGEPHKRSSSGRDRRDSGKPHAAEQQPNSRPRTRRVTGTYN